MKTIEEIKSIFRQHLKDYLPKMYKSLKQKNELETFIDNRAKSVHEQMIGYIDTCMREGYTQGQAEHIAEEVIMNPNIYLEEEEEEEEEEEDEATRVRREVSEELMHMMWELEELRRNFFNAEWLEQKYGDGQEYDEEQENDEGQENLERKNNEKK